MIANVPNLRDSSPFSDSGSTVFRKSSFSEVAKSPTSSIKTLASKSSAGKDYTGARKTNQDSFLVKLNLLGLTDFNIFGVYDGHGMHGHFVSQAVKNLIEAYFTNPDMFLEDLKNNAELTVEIVVARLKANNMKLLKNSYFSTESNISFEKFDCNFSGTTAVTIIQVGKKLISLNAGDSRAILVSCANSNVTK